MSTVDRYIPLFDEVILRNPVAVRLNAIRCLGLADDNSPLSRQTLLAAVVAWKKRENATDDAVTEKLSEILDVNTAVTHAFEDMGVVMKPKTFTEGVVEQVNQMTEKAEKATNVNVLHVLFLILGVVGLIAVLLVLKQIVTNFFSKSKN